MSLIISSIASRWVFAVVAAVATALPMAALDDAPTGQEVVANFVEVSGGKEAYAEIENRVIEATLYFPDHGMEGEMTEIFAPPNYRRVISIDVYDENISGVAGGVAWVQHPMDGLKFLEGDGAFTARRGAQLNPFLDWTSASGEAKVVGEIAVDEEDCYRVEVTPTGGPTITAYFGKESGLLRRIDDRKANLFLYYDDYRQMDGVLVPYKTRFEAGMMMADVTMVSIKQNVDLDDATFDLPAEIDLPVGLNE